MSPRFRVLIGQFLALLLLTSLPAAMPTSRAADGVHQPTLNPSVSGTVQLPGGGIASSALVWLAPLTAGGEFDSSRMTGQYSDLYGGFVFSSVAPGNYGLMIIPPDNQPTARVLNGYTFSVPAGTAPVNLGTISLPLAVKRLTGTAYLGSSPLSGAYVYAYIPGTNSSRSARVANDGSFGFGLEPGAWNVYVGNEPGAPWQFVEPPSVVSFAGDGSSENRTLALTVQSTVGAITGRVLTVDGQPLALPPPGSQTNSPYVYAYGDAAPTGRYEYLDATGAFTMPVVAGSYTLYVIFDESYYQLYAPPPVRQVSAGAGVTAIGVLPLETRDSDLTGIVRDSTGAPIANVLVEASRAGGFVQSTYTDSAGAFSFKLAAATWDIDVVADPWLGFLDGGSSAQVTTATGETTTLLFELTRSANTLLGSFVEEGSGTPLSDVRGWAYARDPESDEYVAWGYVEQGVFTLNVPAGELRIGVFLAPDSRYSVVGEQDFSSQQALTGALGPAQLDALELAPFERAVVVEPADGGDPAATQSVTLSLAVNDATISGQLVDHAGNPITGVPTTVGLTSSLAADAWQLAEVDPSTGRFSATVHAGTWYLLAEIESDTAPFNVPLPDPVPVQVASKATATYNIVLQKLDGKVTGTVRDQDGNPLAGQLVWVSNSFFTATGETSAGGQYEIAVPLLNPDGSVASYTVGGDFSCETLAECYLDTPATTVVPQALLRTGPPSLSQNTSGDITAQRASGGAILRGRLVKDGKPYAGKTVKGGKIANVQIGRDNTDSQGVFEVLLSYGGAGPAEFNGVLEVGSKRIPINGVDRPQLIAGPPQLSQVVDLPEITLDPTEGLPGGISEQFDNARGWSATLPDGTRVEIAPGSVPLASGDGALVRVTVSPTINIFPTAQYAEGSWYGYEISLAAVASNRPIGEDLLSPARITLRYGGLDYALNAIRESYLRPARLSGERWSVATTFLLERGPNKVVFQTKSLGIWALVQERKACENCLYLPLIIR